MKKSLKTLIIMVTVFALILGSIATVAAVPYYNLDTGKEYTAEMLRPGSPDREELKALAPDKIGINIFGKVYSYNGLIAKLAEIFGIGGIGGIQDFFGDEENLKEFEVELPDFEVIEISAIETTFVEVTFDALEDALTDVTVEVKDGEGNVYEVVAQDLAKGATSAQFDFVKAVKADALTGVWTVAGVDYSFDELELVEEIVAEVAKTPVNQVKLLALLNKAGIQNLNEDYIANYASEINSATTTPVWAKDVQKIVDETNKDKAEAKDEAAVVKAVVDATNQIQLLAALEANFERVNADWIADYATTQTIADKTGLLALDEDNYFGTPTNGVDMDDIQTVIDDVNDTAIATADSNADTAAKQAAVTALIQNWVEADDPEDPDNTPKADAIEASKMKEAAYRVAEATTENSLYNALVSYANATEDSVLKASELNANLKAFYLEELNADDGQDPATPTTRPALKAAIKADTIANILAGNVTHNIKTAIVTPAEQAALGKALDNLGTAATNLDADKTNATKKAAFTKALQKLADYTSHYTAADEKFLMSTIDDALLVEYATALKSITNASDVDAVQTAVKGVNDGAELIALVKAINEATSATEVKAALDELAFTDYVNIPSVDKLYVAEQVLELRDTLSAGRDALNATGVASGNTDTEAKKFVDAAEIEGNLVVATTGIIAEYKALIGEFAFAKLTDTATTVTQLGKLGYDAFDDLTAGEKALVAEKFVANYPVDEDGDTVDYTTLAAVKADIDAAIK